MNTIAIPYALTFGSERGKFVPGHGNAGWTVAYIPTNEAATFLAQLPSCAWMPGTHRVAKTLGVES